MELSHTNMTTGHWLHAFDATVDGQFILDWGRARYASRAVYMAISLFSRSLFEFQQWIQKNKAVITGKSLRTKLGSYGTVYRNTKARRYVSSQMDSLMDLRSDLRSKDTFSIVMQRLQKSILLILLHKWRKYEALLRNMVPTIPLIWTRRYSLGSLNLTLDN